MNLIAPGIVYAHLTHPGVLRKTNEDCCATDPAHGVFVVCDGMGGAAAGEVASRLATAALLEHLQTPETSATPPRRLAAAIRAANRAVFQRSREAAGMSGMGTTLVAALIPPNAQPGIQPGTPVWIAHVGDSRCYLLRRRRLRLLTTDHSLVEEQVQAGLLSRAEAENSPVRHVITRAIGSQSAIEPDLQSFDPLPGDLLLLASDGLNRELTHPEIERLLNRTQAPTDLQATCHTLIDAANARGGRDNITVLLIQLAGHASLPATLPR